MYFKVLRSLLRSQNCQNILLKGKGKWSSGTNQ